MRPVTLSRIADWCGGRLQGADAEVHAIDIDSRRLRPQALFVALKGERHDGHDHAAAALAAGAVALLVSRPLDTAAPQVLVDDTQLALGRLAAGMAATRATRIAAITGSNGKTTVKTLLAGILDGAYCNPGNRNNEIGLPLALIEQPEDAAIGIYEMGAGQPGDIAYLAGIARPHASLVNNIGPAHLERMGSLLGIADTKGAIYRALPADGVAVINADDAFAPLFDDMAAHAHRVHYAIDASAEIVAEDIVAWQDDGGAEGSRFTLATPAGSTAIVLPLPGRHNVANALAAAGLALAMDASLDQVAAGLGRATPVAGRQVRHVLSGGALLIDDSYNANPASVGAAIATLAALGQRGREAWLVLGDMKELGADAGRLHAEVGAQARAAGLAALFTVGPLSAAASRAFGAGARHFDDQDGLVEALRAGLSSRTVCLVKGSRSSAMDRVVAALRGHGDGEGQHHAA